MGRIYRESESTIGWLGVSDDGDDNDVLELLGQTGHEAIDFLHVLVENSSRLQSPHSSEQEEAVQELNDGKKWAAVERLLLRPWWRRVWTLQEYIISPHFVFYCGTKSISRDHFRIASLSIYWCRLFKDTLITMFAVQSAWNRRRIYHWYHYGYQMSLLGLIAFGSDSKATDPRDRIYALLELTKDQELVPKPDYNAEVSEVYSKLVKSFVETKTSLDIICFTHLFNHLSDAEPALKPTLPSWVPDWRIPTAAFVVPIMASQSARPYIGNFRPLDKIPLGNNPVFYASAGTTLPDVRFSDGLRLLSCKGILVDYVDGIGGLKLARRNWAGNTEHLWDDCDWDVRDWEVHDYINSTSPTNSPRGTLLAANLRTQDKIDPSVSSAAVEEVLCCLMLGREDRYLSRRVTPSHFYWDFKVFYMAATRNPLLVPSQVVDWFQLNKFLLIRGHTLEELCESAERDIGSPAMAADVNLSKLKTNIFLSRCNDTTVSMARRLITTNEGHIGMGPCRVRKGDRICVLLGCSIPLILRLREGQPSYQVVGECYLHGFMDGEVLKELESGKFKIEEFHLS
jgi:hypothetical protein